MKSLLFALLISNAIPSFGCEFTTLGMKVKVQTRTLNYTKHKEVMKSEGKSRTHLVTNEAGSYSVLTMNGEELKLKGFSVSAEYSEYTTKVNANVSMLGEVLKSVLTEVIGRKKISKRPYLQKYMSRIDDKQNISLSSRFYAFHGYTYGETDDETYDELTLVDPDSSENKMIIGFNFKRYPKCD